MNLLPIELRVKQLKFNLVYNVINDRTPRCLSNYINVSCKQHGINTRSSSLSLHVPYVKSFGQTLFYYTGELAWNELPQHIQSVLNISQLKCLGKRFLFSFLNDQEASSFFVFVIVIYDVIIFISCTIGIIVFINVFYAQSLFITFYLLLLF